MRYRRRRRNPDHVSQALESPLIVVALVGLAAYAIYTVSQGVKNAAAAAENAASAVGGALTGNNALTAGTAYAGAGLPGTLGAATNEVLGGAPQSIGDAIGGAIYSLFHGSTTPLASNPGATSPPGQTSFAPGTTGANPGSTSWSY